VRVTTDEQRLPAQRRPDRWGEIDGGLPELRHDLLDENKRPRVAVEMHSHSPGPRAERPQNGLDFAYQSRGLRTLAASCPCQPRDRWGRAHHTRLADTRARGPKDDERLRARQAERQFEPLSQARV